MGRSGWATQATDREGSSSRILGEQGPDSTLSAAPGVFWPNTHIRAKVAGAAPEAGANVPSQASGWGTLARSAGRGWLRGTQRGIKALTLYLLATATCPGWHVHQSAHSRGL